MSLGKGRLRRRLSNPRLQIALAILIIFLPVALILLRKPAEVAEAWFDETFGYRQRVAITNSGSALTDYQEKISLDTATLITAGKIRSDCYDLRVTDNNGNLLPHWVETGTNACNTATTAIWTKVPSIPTSGAVLYVYYGNPQAAQNPQEPQNVFQYFDDFSQLDTGKWTTANTPTVAGGILTLSSSAAVVSKSTVTDSSGLARLIVRAKQAATTLTGGKIGFSNASTNATHFNNDDAVALSIGSTEEQISQTASTNLVSHHKLEETTSTDANQFKGSGYLDTGKLSQAVSMYGNAAGTTGSTLTFNRGAQISGANYERLNGNQGSVSFWVKSPTAIGSIADDQYLFDFGDATGNRIALYMDASTDDLTLNRNGTETTSAGITFAADTWYHIVVLYNFTGDSYTVYQNNSSVISDSTALTAPTPPSRNFIGSEYDGTSQAQALIDDFIVYDRVLSSSEISSLYNSGTGREAGYVADPSLKFYAKLDGSGTLSPVTYNAGASAAKHQATSGELTGGLNLVTDGNMETVGMGNWTNVGTPTTSEKATTGVYADTQSLHIVTDAVGEGVYQDITVSANTNYHFEAWGKITSGIGAITLYDQDNSSNYGLPILSGSSWARYTMDIKTNAGNTTLRIYFRADSGEAYMDNAVLTPNLVDNGGMEGTYATCNTSQSCPPGWTSTAGTVAESATAHSGSKSVSISGASGTPNTYQTGIIPTATTGWYLISFWAYGTSGEIINTQNLSTDWYNRNFTIGTSSTWERESLIAYKDQTHSSSGDLIFLRTTGTNAVLIDDVSVIPLDSTALSLQSWTPVDDAATGANDLSIHGDSDGVTSTTSGARSNGYTFDGSTGYLRQKTYDVNIGTLTYADSNTDISDDGQEFEDWDNDDAGSAEYMVVVTNSDNTTSWGYFCANDGGTQTAVYTLKACTGGSEGFNGTSPSGKTPVGYEIRKTDYQITGALTLGLWMKTSTANVDFLEKWYYDSAGVQNLSFSEDLSDGAPRFHISTTGTGGIDVISATTVNDNAWHFLTFTFEPSTAIRIYIDGKLDVSNTTSIPATLFDSWQPFKIGHRWANVDWRMNGSIDSPFVIGAALTSDQIKDIYNSTAAHYGLVTNNATANSAPANQGSPTNDTNYNTFSLIAQTSQISLSQGASEVVTSTANLPNSAQYLRMQNADSSNALTVDWVAVAKGAGTVPAVAAPASEEKSEGPVSYWKFDDGTGSNAQDSSPNNNDGTISGATWQTEDMCVSGKCLKFDGSDDNVDAGDPSNGSFDLGTGDFSLGAWVKTGTTAGASLIFKETNPGQTNRQGFDLYFRATNPYIQFVVGDGTNYAGGFSSVSTTYADNKWHYISVTKTSSLASLYFDGKLITTQSTSAVTGTVNTEQNLLIGGKSGVGYLNGFIDDVKIYNYARTAAQVKADYNSRGASKGLTLRTQGQTLPDALSNGLVGYWKMDESAANSCTGGANDSCDSSGNGRDGAWQGNAANANGKFGNGVTLDGVDDYVNVSESDTLDPLTGSLTASAWVKISKTVSGSDVIVQKGATSATVLGYWWDTVFTNGYQRLYISDGSSYIVNGLIGSKDIADGNWHYVSFTWDPKNGAKLYADGVLDGQTSVTTNVSINATIAATIGGYTSTGYTLNGSLDDVRVYNRALSSSEIRALYNWAPGPEIYLKLEEGSGTSANDDSGNGRTGTLNNNSTWVPGKFGKGVKLDGTNDSIQLDDF